MTDLKGNFLLLPTPPGPRPQKFTPLSKNALKLLHRELFYHERAFIKELPSLYDLKGINVALEGQGMAFECLAFASGLREAVMIGWGDGRIPSGEKPTEAWISMAWESTKKTFQMPRLQNASEDIRSISAVMDGCRIDKMQVASTPNLLLVGHRLLYYPPGTPALDLLLQAPLSSVHGDFVLVEEQLMASVLDYPFPMPVALKPSTPTTLPTCASDTLAVVAHTSAEPLMRARYQKALDGIVNIGMIIYKGNEDMGLRFACKNRYVLDMVKRSIQTHEALLSLEARGAERGGNSRGKEMEESSGADSEDEDPVKRMTFDLLSA